VSILVEASAGALTSQAPALPHSYRVILGRGPQDVAVHQGERGGDGDIGPAPHWKRLKEELAAKVPRGL